jgi:hypothetical protein
MRYDLLITEITNENSRKVLAHQLARDPGTSYQDALQKLQKLPVTLFRDLDEQTMTQLLGQYLKYGVKLKAAPAHQPPQPAPKNQNESSPQKKQTEKPEVTARASRNLQDILQFDDLSKRAVTVKNVSDNSPIDRVESDEKKKRKNEQAILISLLVIFLVIPLLLLFISSGKKHVRQITAVGVQSSQGKSRGDEHLKDASSIAAPSKASKRKSVTVAEKKKSASMCDSARAAGVDAAMMINFYKIAISFNKYNLDAWFGLLAAYKSAAMSDEYQKACNQMKELFGEDVLEISSQISRYGDIGDMYVSEEGVLTLKIDVEKASRNVLEDKVYSLIKILHSNYNYQSISVVAGDKKRDRMVVHIRPGMEITTFADFKKNASMIVFDK